MKKFAILQKRKPVIRVFGVVVMTFLLSGMIFACSQSNDDPNNDLNEHQQVVENNEDKENNEAAKNNEDDENNEVVKNNDFSNENITSDQEERAYDQDENGNRLELPVDTDEPHNDQQNNLSNEGNGINDAVAEGEKVDTPIAAEQEPDRSDDNGRPTLRSPVNSDDDDRALTVGMFSIGSSSRDRTSFREIYTRSFEWKHPNVDIEFSTVTNERIDFPDQLTLNTAAELKKLVTGDHSPDVLFLSYNDYVSLMEEDLLVALNPFFTDSELSLNDFEPIVADGLVNPQDGQTYGLSPFFNASALIYNKDLFDEMNVPYPRDHMTWEEIFTLAKQMTQHDDERSVYGLAFDLFNHQIPTLHDVWKRYAHSYEVQIFDQTTGTAAVNNERWARIFSNMKDLYDAGVFPIPIEEDDETEEADKTEEIQISGGTPFYANMMAMGIVEYPELRRIIDDTAAGLFPVPNWDIVTIPVDPEHPHIGAGVVMDPVIAINANGKNQLDAWRLIESLHSAEWANINEERYISNLSSRQDHAVNLAQVDYNKAAFYKLRPSRYYEGNRSVLGSVNPYINFEIVGNSSLFNLLSGEWEVQEALEQWEDVINNYEERFNIN